MPNWRELMFGMGGGGYGNSQSPQQGLDLRSIVNSMGNDPTSRMLQSDINRNVLPGTKSFGAEQYDPSQLAQIDRYAWGQQGGLGGLPLVAGYEGVKAASQLPGMGSLMSGLGQAGDYIGIPKASEYLKFDENTSPASFGNISSFFRGATDDWF